MANGEKKTGEEAYIHWPNYTEFLYPPTHGFFYRMLTYLLVESCRQDSGHSIKERDHSEHTDVEIHRNLSRDIVFAAAFVFSYLLEYVSYAVYYAAVYDRLVAHCKLSRTGSNGRKEEGTKATGSVRLCFINVGILSSKRIESLQ
ncbi:hypothetical protein BDC45DRAFT_531589 [Circinella umbellata]|nr:hypothetical protein BDC45DRAFT_531589 [Circinella umbellata]